MNDDKDIRGRMFELRDAFENHYRECNHQSCDVCRMYEDNCAEIRREEREARRQEQINEQKLTLGDD